MYAIRLILIVASTCLFACAPRAGSRTDDERSLPPDLERLVEAVDKAVRAGDVKTLRQHLVTTGDEKEAARQLSDLAGNVGAIRREASRRFGDDEKLPDFAGILPMIGTRGKDVVRGDEALMEIESGRGFWFRRVRGRWRLAYAASIRSIGGPGSDFERTFMANIARQTVAARGVRERLERGEFPTFHELRKAVMRDVARRAEVTIGSDQSE